MTTPSLRRPGATLFALVTGLSFTGLLCALLFPGLLKLRDLAKQTRCRNNLHHIGIGIHNHIAVTNNLPTTGVGDPDPDKAGSGSWCYQITPYLEESEVFKEKGEKRFAAVFYSPTRRVPQLYNKLAKTDYAGNAGTDDDPTKLKNEDGVFSPKGVDFNAIVNSDGASFTLMVGVKGLRTTDYQTGKGKGDAGSCWAANTVDTLRTSNGDKRPPVRDSADADNERGFGAPTEKVMNILLCDSAVRRWRYDAKNFDAMCSRNDGKWPKFDD